MSNYDSHKVHGNLSKNTYLNTAPAPYIFYQAHARLIAKGCAKIFFLCSKAKGNHRCTMVLNFF